jgi:amino acid transporter
MGITWSNPDVFTAAAVPPLDSLGEVTLLVFYAFVGFESAVVPAGEARDARRDIPLALIRTILAVTVFYFLIQLVVVSVMPGIDGEGASLSRVAEELMGPAGALLLTLGAVFSIGGNLSASMLSAPRMLYAMAHHGNLPAHLGRVDRRFQTPANAVLVYGLLALGLALVGDFAGMAVMSTVVRLIIYVTCIAALPVLNWKLGASAGAFYLPGGMLIPALAFLMSLWLMSHANAESWFWTGIYVAIGSAVYLLWRRFGRQS